MVAVSAGSSHTVATTRVGSVFGWGNTEELGMQDPASEDVLGVDCVFSACRYLQLSCGRSPP